MAYLAGAAPETASPELTQMWGEDEAQWGFVPNFAKTFGVRPAVYAAWRALNTGIRESMGTRRYELATLAAAVELRSSYCALAHGRVLARKVLDEADVAAVVRGEPVASLDDVDRAVMELARAVVRGADRVTEADLAELRSYGLGDDEIFDVILAAAARCFFSKVLDATGTLPDAVFLDLDEQLRTALTVGRPIDAGSR
jgi:uncharacterized peroxidase-related enzyme